MEQIDIDTVRETLHSLGEYAEARTESTSVHEYSMKNGVLLGAAAYGRSGVGVRFLQKGSLGFYSTTNSADLSGLSSRVSAMAQRSLASSESYALSQEEVYNAKYSVVQKEPVQNVSPEQCIELLKTIDANGLRQ